MRIIVGYISETDEPFAKLLPIGCGYIHAVLAAAGFDSLLVNFSAMTPAERVETVVDHAPAVVFLSQFTHNRLTTIELARAIKGVAPGAVLILGGPHATFTGHDLLLRHPEIDAIVMGEGEDTCLDVVRALGSRNLAGVPGLLCRESGRIVKTSVRPVIENLDRLPMPAVYAGESRGVDLRRQLEFIITSRGCPSSCVFCSSPSYWGRRIRYRSPAEVVKEIKFLRDTYGLIYFSIRDDTFTCSKKRVIDFCKKLLEERVYILWNCQSRVSAVDAEILSWLKRAGCESIQYGIESGAEDVLKNLGKSVSIRQAKEAARLTREAGIRLSIYLITGVPGETDADVKKTLALVEELKAEDGQVSPLVYYPGTALFQSAVTQGKIAPNVFAAGKGESFPVRPDSFGATASKTILRRLDAVAKRTAPTAEGYAALRRKFGYTHVGNISEAEYHLREGNYKKALMLYREVVRVEADNPWGWLMLAELHASLDDVDEAVSCYTHLVRLVPRHAPGYAALAELYEAVGNSERAHDALCSVVELDPWDEEARRALRRVEKKIKKAKP